MDNALLKLLKSQLEEQPELLQEDMKMYFEELKDLRRRKFRKILSQQYTLETLGDYYKNMKKIECTNAEKLKLQTAKAHKNLYLFITINPKPEIKFDVFHKKMEKLVNRNIFKKGMYVLEQRGTTIEDAGKGFHCHMLCTRNLDYKPCKVSACIRNTCKTLCNANDRRVLNIQFIGEEFMEDKRNYVLGHNKTGEGKSEKQDMDVHWRKKNNLKLYYNDAHESQTQTSS